MFENLFAPKVFSTEPVFDESDLRRKINSFGIDFHPCLEVVDNPRVLAADEEHDEQVEQPEQNVLDRLVNVLLLGHFLVVEPLRGALEDFEFENAVHTTCNL